MKRIGHKKIIAACILSSAFLICIAGGQTTEARAFPVLHYGDFGLELPTVPNIVQQITFTNNLSRGNTGDEVSQLQSVLSALEYYLEDIDESFGPATDQAVRRFQADYGLVVDGSVGPITRDALNSALSGTLTKVETTFTEAAEILDQIGWNLKTAYNWVVNHSYFAVGYNFTETSRWYADYFYTNGGGNCYCFSCAFYELAKALGYDAHVVNGYVPYAAGGYGLHSWVEIDMDGGTWVCDPEFEHEEGINGYWFQYGRAGTWVYTAYSRIN